MKKLLLAAAAAMLMGSGAYADTIKVGVVGPFSGPFSLQGKNFKSSQPNIAMDHRKTQQEATSTSSPQKKQHDRKQKRAKGTSDNGN